MSLRSLLIAGAAVFALALPSGAEAQTAAATTSDLNLRAGPGTAHGVITSMPARAQVTVHQCTGGWCQVNYAGRTGWASQRYLDMRVAHAPEPEWRAGPPTWGPVYEPHPRLGFEFHVGPRRDFHWRDWHRPARFGGWHHPRWWHDRPAGWYGPVYWDRDRWWYRDRWHRSPGFAFHIGVN